MDGKEEIDGLYRLPVAEFTAARNALAARLQKAGQGDAASEVKALAKPSLDEAAASAIVRKLLEAKRPVLHAGGHPLRELLLPLPVSSLPQALQPESWAMKYKRPVPFQIY